MPTVVVIGDVAGICVDVLVEVNVNMLTGVMIEVKFAISASLDGFSCWAAFDCRSMVALKNRERVLQTWTPSYHV